MSQFGSLLYPSGRLWGKTSVRSLLAAVLIVLTAYLTTGCGSNRQPAADGSSGAPSESPTAIPKSEPVCPTPMTNVASSTGDALRATVLDFTGPSGMANIVLPTEALRAFPEVTHSGKWVESPGLFERAFAAGAFAYGGGRVRLSMKGDGDEEVSVFDVRPANVVAECMPTGAALLMGAEGGDPIRFEFNLDAASPQAREPSANGNGSLFFEKNTLVFDTEKDTIIVDFKAGRGAYSFDLAFKYEVGGQTYTQVVPGPNGPFRVAAALCPSKDQRKELGTNDVESLRALRHEYVWERKPLPDNSAAAVVAVPPEQYAADCSTLS